MLTLAGWVMNQINNIITLDLDLELEGLEAEHLWLYAFIKHASINGKYETLETLISNQKLNLKERQIRYLLNDLLRLNKVTASHHVLTKAGFTTTRPNADRVNSSQGGEQ